jgi:tetratricopeptide (TPR) repeat protein/transglutaminase-like putative cysteine protease
MDADVPGAIRAYREALLALAGTPAADRSPARAGEAELALRRLAQLSVEGDAVAPARPVYERWMDPATAGDENLAALARFIGGRAALRAATPAEAAKIWEPLGFLRSYRLAGPFDNERGGGFSAELGPEKDQAAASAAGRLLRFDASASWPGKVRPVSWRKLPAEPVAGAVDLDALFRPNDEVLAYALTFIESESDQPAALRLASDEGVKVWVNGAMVLSRDVRRPCTFDQDAAAIRLRKGWNSLLLKVTEAKGSWKFEARLTRPDGGPLGGWKEGEPPDGLELTAPAAVAQAGEAAPPSQGARDLLRAATSAEAPAGAGSGGDGASGRLDYLLGSILLLTHAHDEGEHPDRELLRKAISLSPGGAPAAYQYMLAKSCERSTAITADRDDNDWREALLAAKSSHPPSIQAALDLADYYLETFGNTQIAEKLIEGLEAEGQPIPEAALIRARIEERRGSATARLLALERLGKAFRADALPESFDPQVARELAARLRAEGRLPAAEELLRALIGRDRLDEVSRRLLDEVLVARGRPEEALALLEEAHGLEPFEMDPLLARGRILEGLDRASEALAAVDEALRIAPEDAEVLGRRGDLLKQLGRKEEAVATWEKALAIQPNFPALREHLEFLKSRRDEFADRWRRDAGPAIAAALAEPAGGDDPVRVILDLHAVNLNPDGTVKEFRQFVARAMNDQGIRTLGRYGTPYSAGEQRVEFEAARVHRPGGAVEEARLTVHEGGGQGGWREASIDLPPVRAGDVIEVRHITEDLRPSFFGDYFSRRVRLRGDSPAAERTFVLQAPAERKLHFHQRNLTLAPVTRQDDPPGTVTYIWTLRDVEAERPEPGMPPREEIDPLVEVSTFGSWEAFAGWYWNLVRRQFEVSPQISAKVAELTSGAASDDQKIRAIYDFVTGEVRYNAWEFGIHGFKPYNASAIFARRFGDCKDKAELMATMLGAAGIQAYPVIIRAAPQGRADEDITLPMVDHFNHCIAYVPPTGGRPGRFLDGTAEHHAVDELPAMDRGAKVLVVKDGGGEIVQVPWNSPEEIGAEEEVQADIAEDGSATVEVRLRARGDSAAEIRQFFEVAGRRRRELEKIYGARFAGSSVTGERFSDLADRSKPVEFQVTLRVPALLQSASEGRVLPVLDDFFETARELGTFGSLETRRHELVLGPPHQSKLAVTQLLPPGLSARSLPADREISGRFGLFSLKHEKSREGGREKVVTRRIIQTTAPRVSLADYPEFRELAAAAARLKDEKLVIEAGK